MEVESRIVEVTLYARGARVRRVTTIAAPGPRVRVIGLPLAVIDDTVRVEVEGGAVVTAVHVGAEAPAAEAAAAEDVAEVVAARRRVALVEAEVERLDAQLATLAAAPIAPGGAPGVRGEPPPAWAAVVEARRQLVTLRAERELALRDRAAAARRAADEARRALLAVRDRDRRAGSARPARLHELRKHVELAIEGTGRATVHVEYQVAAARWAPSYVARLDGERVQLEVRAVIAQATGEDWAGVRLRLSTAEPEQFGALPELAAQRIGRRQHEPARAGFRAPPVGAAELYRDYLRGFPAPPARRAAIAQGESPPSGMVAAELAGQVWDEESSRAKQAYAMPPPGMMPAPGPAAPPEEMTVLASRPSARTVIVAAAPQAFLAMPEAASEGGGIRAAPARHRREAAAAPPAPPPPAPPPPAPPPPRLDYAHLRMAPPGSPDRGTLVPVPPDTRGAPIGSGVDAGIRQVHALALPHGCSASWPHTYDYAFATDGAVDVGSDGTWHAIAVTAAPASATLRHVAVPRVQPDAFRIAAIANPLPGPLLPGPIDVYDRGKFLITSAVEHTPPGARVEIGLGVDPQVKLARNTEFREETTGVLRGGLRLHHAIAIDIDNLSERAIELEVRERLPVTREGDDEIDVVIGRVEPAWERWTPDPGTPGQRRLRGGHRWRVTLPPRTQRTLRAAYEVRIAGKLELIGGNRRES